MQKHTETLMQKEMTRKEFLTTVGFGLVTVMGFSSILKLLTGKSLHRDGISASGGYGSSAYGGSKRA